MRYLYIWMWLQHLFIKHIMFQLIMNLSSKFVYIWLLVAYYFRNNFKIIRKFPHVLNPDMIFYYSYYFIIWCSGQIFCYCWNNLAQVRILTKLLFLPYIKGCSYGGEVAWLTGLARLAEMTFISCSHGVFHPA